MERPSNKNIPLQIIKDHLIILRNKKEAIFVAYMAGSLWW